MINTVHIVDDDSAVRAAISYLLSGHDYSTHVYASGAEFLHQRRLRSGCILLDLRMDGPSGLEVLEELERRGSRMPVIAMSGNDDIDAIVQSMKLGAADFIKKPYDPAELLVAIERVRGAAGRRVREHGARVEAEAKLRILSPRQLEILRGLLAGMTNKEIARRLDLSPRTVEMHRLNMIRALGLRTTSAALRLALAGGLEPLDSDQATAAPRGEELTPPAVLRPVRRNVAQSPSSLEELLPPVIDVIEGTTDGVLLLDHEFEITYANRNAIEILRPVNNLVGGRLWELFPGAARTRAFDELERAASQRKAVRFDVFEPDLGRWFDVSGRPIPGGLQVFFRDQSRERSACAELKRSEERLRLSLEASGDAAWDWDIRNGWIAISPCFVSQLGYDPSSAQLLELETVQRLIHPCDRARVTDELESHLAGRTESFACEYRIRRGGGGWMWCLERGRIVARDPATGVPTRMVGTISDIGWLKDIRARADESSERIALAQEGAGAGTWDLDLRHRHVRMCRRAREMHGIAADGPDEMHESVWEATVDPADVGRAKAAMDRAIATGQTYAQKYRTILPGGERRWVFALGRPVADPGDAPSRFVGILLDDTEREVAAQELRMVREELASVYRMTAIGTVANNLAHELNQPLTALRSYASALRTTLTRRKSELEQAVAAVADCIEASTKLASRIVDRARDQTRWTNIETGPEYLERIAADAAATFADDRVEIDVEIAPPANEVCVDRLYIQQVLVNLIRNAADAMLDTGGRRVTISARCASQSEVEVRVRDEGPGIPDEIRERIFSPFVTTKPNGVGIGLAICRTIVEAHGGGIWTENAPEGGAEFVFTIPHHPAA